MRVTNRKPVNNPVVERISDTLSIRGIGQNDLISHLGLSNGTFTRWKYDGGTSYMEHLDEIAAYLHVSKEFLLYGTDDEGVEMKLQPSEVTPIKKLRELSPEQRNLVYQTIKDPLQNKSFI